MFVFTRILIQIIIGENEVWINQIPSEKTKLGYLANALLHAYQDHTVNALLHAYQGGTVWNKPRASGKCSFHQLFQSCSSLKK